MTEPILQLEHVSYIYPDGPMAVEDLSVSIEKGERVAVLGRNGAGKSTFFLLCNGILEAAEGTIRCGGKLLAAAAGESVLIEDAAGATVTVEAAVPAVFMAAQAWELCV